MRISSPRFVACIGLIVGAIGYTMLAPATTAPPASTVEAISTYLAKLPPGVPPYSRSDFGDGWAATGHGCDVRQEVLQRDIVAPTVVTRCGPTAGTLHDPYTGTDLVGPTSLLDIDHLVPLGWAWSHGASAWPAAQRVQFYNDVSNLVTVDAHSNRAKGDDGLDRWLPPSHPCTYALRFQTVANRYGLYDSALPAEVQVACR